MIRSHEINRELINAGKYHVKGTQYKLGDETIIQGLNNNEKVKDNDPNLLKFDFLKSKYVEEIIKHNKKEFNVLIV